MLATSDTTEIASCQGAHALPASSRLERTLPDESGPWEPRELGPVPEQLLESFGISRTASCQEPEISADVLGRPDLEKGLNGRTASRQEVDSSEPDWNKSRRMQGKGPSGDGISGGTGEDTAQKEKKRVSEDPSCLQQVQKKR